MPADAWIVRPRGLGLVATVEPFGARRAFGVLSGIAGLAVAVLLIRRDGINVLAWFLSIPALAAFTALAVLQPRVFFYVAGDRVGIHLTFGTRFEVPASEVRTVHVTTASSLGVPAWGVRLESADGRRLLYHGNATYDEDDLRELARRIGADFRDE